MASMINYNINYNIFICLSSLLRTLHILKVFNGDLLVPSFSQSEPCRAHSQRFTGCMKLDRLDHAGHLSPLPFCTNTENTCDLLQ